MRHFENEVKTACLEKCMHSVSLSLVLHGIAPLNPFYGLSGFNMTVETCMLPETSYTNLFPHILQHTLFTISRSMLAKPLSVMRVKLGIITASTLCPPNWSKRTLPGGVISACTTTNCRLLEKETHGVRHVL